MDTRFEKINTVNSLIKTLQVLVDKYGNIPVNIDLSSEKDEGEYEIDDILYSTDSNGNGSISLIIW